MRARSFAGRACAVALAAALLATACGGGTAEPDISPAAAPAPAGGDTPASDGAERDDTGTPATEPAPPTAGDTAGPADTADGPGDEGRSEVVADDDAPPPAPADGGETASFETVPTAPETSEGDAPAEPSADTTEVSEPPPNIYDDPRGGIFVEFQRGFDRDHPFGSLDAFCLPHDPPAEQRRATDAGIGADSITLVHMRTQIEELMSSGFAVDVGDPTDMFDTLTRIVNERCGGVWGRQIDLRVVEVSALGVGGVDIDTLRNAACIEATENHDGVIVMNATTFAGTAQLCITEEHDSVLIGHEPLPAEYLRRGGGRLLTTATTLEEILNALAAYVLDTGALEGRRVAVVAPNTPGEAEAVEGSLVAALEAAGVDLRVFDVLDCAGTSFCVGGLAESVQRLIEEDVDVLFPTLNAVSLPGYINEMVTQGLEPGDVQIYNSDFNSQGNEVVADLILTFGGAAAGELYDGSVLLVTTDQGRFRDPGWEPSPFGEMCMREYRENSPLGEDYDPRHPVDTNKYGILGLICSEYRVALRALYDAGPNPSRADIVAALENLGPVDVAFMLPASLAPGKWAMGDSLQPVTFRRPCPFEGLGTKNDICLLPSDYDELLVKV
ncbi:MAG: hypothetical protein OXP08_07760, partial [bacterium]|nr:hypothetical protein [bacterium]